MDEQIKKGPTWVWKVGVGDMVGEGEGEAVVVVSIPPRIAASDRPLELF